MERFTNFACRPCAGPCFHEGPQRSEPLFLLVQMYQLMSPVKLRRPVFFAQVIGIVKSERENFFPGSSFPPE